MRKNQVICLGIESTAHTFGVGIVNSEGRVLADERITFKPKIGGIHPREAFFYLADKATSVVKRALENAGLKMKEIDIVAFSQGPGLPPCLKVGGVVARVLTQKYNKPLIGVNHCVAHVEIGKLSTGAKDPVVLYVSGANTQVLAAINGRYRCLGETLDLPIGNALDMLGRELGIPTPAGPEIDKLAERGKWIGLPYVVKGMDLSFSGILTAAKNKLKEGAKPEDICYSFEQVCFAMLVEVTERALAYTGKDEVLLTGGVAASPILQKMLRVMCEERGAKVYIVPRRYAGDNGVMIAWTGVLAYKSGLRTSIDEPVNPRWRTDDAPTPWLKTSS